MSEREDLTRWNRAGRNRFDYIDGNAVEFLEILRQRLVRQFADPETGLCGWLNPPQQVPANEAEQKDETLVQRQKRTSLRNQRLLETYRQDRRDWAWEISRSFARCCHMLTEHASAYANEGFLGTATQWEHVRRLVEMLDYHPAPPASASTWLSFAAKEGKSGLVPKGFQVKNSPRDGGDKVIFETLEDVFIDGALNELRPKGWNHSEQSLLPLADGKTGSTSSAKQLLAPQQADKVSVQTTWIIATKPAVEPGEVAMILDEASDQAEAVTLNRVDEIDAKPPFLELDLLTSPLQNSWGQWKKGDTLLRYSPRWHKKCWLNGTNVIRTKEAHGLTAEAYIGWKDNDDNWQYAKITESDRRNLRLEEGVTVPEIGSVLYQLTPVEGRQVAANLDVVVVLDENSGDMTGEDAVEDVYMEVPSTDDIFTLIDIPEFSDSGISVSLPGGLPGIGSFLFPSPFLPVDLVKAAVELMLNLGLMQIPSTEEFVIKGFPPNIDGVNPAEQTLSSLASALYNFLDSLEVNGTEIVDWGGDSQLESEDKLLMLLGNAAIGNTPLFQQIQEGLNQKGPILAISKQADRIAEVIDPDPLYMFDGTPDRIQKDDWVVAEFDKGLAAVSISEIESFTDDEDKIESFGLYIDNPSSQADELRMVHADFRGKLVPQDAKINFSPIVPEDFKLERVPENLKVGRQVLVTGCGEPYPVKIMDIDMEGDRVTFDPPLSACPAGKLVIRGNVVQAGHGEIQPWKIIGSGNAAKSNQGFTLEVEGVSFTPDATKDAGVAAAIEVEVAGRLWEQVSSLKDSVSDDHHYEIRMTEEGYVKIIFGDGNNGRRLPSGTNNIRVRYRVGSGETGNVPADSLIKAIKPNPSVDSVSQPLPATGGGDMEDLASLRDNAPPTLLAFKRAVSLSDFSHLAAAQSSVWQARAYRELLHGGRMTQVTVIVVPAGGVFSLDIKNELQTYLQNQSLPGVKVTVEPYKPQTVDLKVTIKVDFAAFLPAEIEAVVKAELLRHFALKNRGLGEPLYLSEVYKVVEGIEGVESSICLLNGNTRVVDAGDRTSVVHLDISAGSTLIITPEEYRP